MKRIIANLILIVWVLIGYWLSGEKFEIGSAAFGTFLLSSWLCLALNLILNIGKETK